ncbi:MAG: class IV adenylate cyclase [Candidatus Nomurabacteria bacterium]|nr:class IV adenylate cyclase [Candidatus Nomurabacteria bacterium]
MKQNLELKYFCNDFNKIRSVLKEIGAKKEIIKNQKDYFFNLPIDKTRVFPRLKLRVQDKELIYYERPNFVKGKNTLAKIEVYKVKDAELLPFLIKVFGVRAIVEKKREIWRKDNTVFYIDKVKNVGNIFEVEMQKNSAMTQKDKELFESYKKKLLPHLGAMIKGSNIDLVLENYNK